jgi:predicted Zn-dependent peptidase
MPHGVDTDGYPDLLKTITGEELSAAYREMMACASLTVVAGGDLGASERGWLLERLSRLPSGKRHEPPIPGASPSPCRIPDGCREKIESRPMEQARILAVLTGLPPYFSGEGMVINVLNSMLGADTHSLLFEHVRERLGLAYSVFTSVLRYVRGIAVYAGVAPSSVEIAMKTVMEQVDSMAQGLPDDTVFRHSVTMVRNQLLTLSDSLSALLGFYSSGLSNGRLFHVTDALRLLDDVTPDKVRALASELRLSSVFIVMPENLGEETT